MNLELLNRWLGPPLSLAAGLVAVFVLRREASFAPWAVAVLLAAWFAAAVLGRLLPGLQEEGRRHPRWLRRLAGYLLRSLVSGLYQNVLFFLVPLYCSSAVWPSANMIFALLLVAMAIFSCFEEPLRRLVLERAGPRAAWSGAILFAALVPACSVLGGLPLRWTVSGAAALSAACAAAMSVRRGRASGKALLALAAGAAAFLAMIAGARLIPPVPVQCLAAASGTAIEDRELVGRADAFPQGTERVYSWFAVAAPGRFRGAVRFEYRAGGRRIGKAFEASVVGGRKAGFRTWCYFSRPWPGRWTVELRTDAGQLVARQRFEVLAASAP